jgi:spermidine/putrescine transport system permease protein
MATRLSTLVRSRGYALLSLPAVLWLVFFFVAPLLIVFAISFMTRGNGGLPVFPLTLDNYNRTFNTFGGVIWQSVRFSIITTVICLLMGYPIAYFIKTRKTRWGKNFALFLVILPFWTNFLIRTYAWKFLLAREGFLNGLLLESGLITEPLKILNTEFAVMLGLVYGMLPFMVLPIYASLERFDFHYVEAAQDLGANAWHVFWRVLLPMTLPGVIAGCVLVFIPTIGSYITPDMLGGNEGLMISTLLASQLTGSGNMPQGAAISMVLLSMVLIPIFIYLRTGNREARNG